MDDRLLLQNMFLNGWMRWAETSEMKEEGTGQSGQHLGRRTWELFLKCFKEILDHVLNQNKP